MCRAQWAVRPLRFAALVCLGIFALIAVNLVTAPDARAIDLKVVNVLNCSSGSQAIVAPSPDNKICYALTTQATPCLANEQFDPGDAICWDADGMSHGPNWSCPDNYNSDGAGVCNFDVATYASCPPDYSLNGAGDTCTEYAPLTPPGPTVTSVNPSSGTTVGGTPITISGSGFTNATGVTIGGVAAINVNVLDDSTITAITPAGSAGTAGVVVTTLNGSNGDNSNFTYVAPPPDISPQPTDAIIVFRNDATFTSGTNASGATVQWQVSTDAGASFTDITDDGVYSGATTNSLLISLPPISMSGYLYHLVVTSGGLSTTSNAATLTINSPTTTTLSSQSNPAASGGSETYTATVKVSIFVSSGTVAFTDGGTTIAGCGAVALVAVKGQPQATCTETGLTAGTHSIRADFSASTTYESSSDTLTQFVVDAPSVTSLTPSLVLTGTSNSILVQGSGFDISGGTIATVGGSAATVNSCTKTACSVNAPGMRAGVYDIVMTVNGVSSAITNGDQLTYAGVPTVTSPTAANIAATSATLGGNVTSDGGAALTKVGVLYAKTTDNSNPQMGGTGVNEVDGATATGIVTVNSTGLTLNTGYSFVAFATNSLGTSYSSVGTFTTLASSDATLADLSDSSGNFNEAFAPATTSYTQTVPNDVSSITVQPTVSQANATVTVNNAPVASGSSSGNIALAVGLNTITVIVTAQDRTTTKKYQLAVTRAAAIPTVTELTPATGTSVGGTTVTISGSGFDPMPTNNTVKFGEALATVTAATTTSLTVTSPAGSARVDVAVTVGGQTSRTGVDDQFTYTALPVVTINPTDQTVMVKQMATFSADATNYTSILWQVSRDNGVSWSTFPGANVTSINPATSTTNSSGFLFRALFTNDAGWAYSKSASLTINPSPTPLVTLEPSDQIVSAGQTATFTAAATGSPTPGIQWKVSSDGGKTFADVSGANSTTLNVATDPTTAASLSGGLYEAVFSNTSGSATTNLAKLIINAPPVANAGNNQTVNGGTLVTLDATSSSDSDNGKLSYSWKQTMGPTVTLSDATAVKPTFTAPNLAIGIASEDLAFSLIVTDGQVASPAATVKITVNQPVTATLALQIPNPLAGQANSLVFTLLGTQSGSLQSLHMFAAISPTAPLLQLANFAQPPAVTVAFFMDGNPIAGCAQVPLDANNVAVCQWMTAPGQHTLSAKVNNSTINAVAVTSNQVIVAAVNPVMTNATAIGGFLSDRANQIVTNQPGTDRQTDRLNAALDAQGGSGAPSNFAASGKGDFVPSGKGDLLPQGKGDLLLNNSRLGNGPTGQTITAARLGMSSDSAPGPANAAGQDMMGFQSFLYNYLKTAGESGNFGQFNFSGPMDINANFGLGGGHSSFKTSLSQMMQWQHQNEQKEMAAMGFGKGGGASSFIPLDIWTEGVYSSYSGPRSGSFGMATIGTDYVFNPNLLAGFYGQLDLMNQTSGAALSGAGWMVGPYATLRLGENVFWQGKAGWGKSSNGITPSPAGTDTFGTTRWLVSSSLSGKWKFGDGWAFAPTASFTYFDDRSDSYIDHFGTTIPGVDTNLGQFKLSPELGYVFVTDSDVWIEPSLATELIWNFASTNIDGLGGLNGDAIGPTGLRGRLKAGLNIKMPSGIAIGATGTFDGIGSGGYSAISGQATVTVPLK